MYAQYTQCESLSKSVQIQNILYKTFKTHGWKGERNVSPTLSTVQNYWSNENCTSEFLTQQLQITTLSQSSLLWQWCSVASAWTYWKIPSAIVLWGLFPALESPFWWVLVHEKTSWWLVLGHIPHSAQTHLHKFHRHRAPRPRISHLESLAEGRSAWSCERGCDSAWLSRHGWRPLGTKEICWCSEPPLDVCHQPPTCWPALTPPGQPGSTDLQSKERMEQLVSCPLPPWGAILMLQYKSTLARAKLTTRSLVMQQ